MRYSRLLLVVGSVLTFSCKKHNDVPPPITRLTGERYIAPKYATIDYSYEVDDAGRMTRYLMADTSGKTLIRTNATDSVLNYLDLNVGTIYTDRYTGSVYGEKPTLKRRYAGGSAVADDTAQYSYDAGGRITRIVSDYGNVADISYDGKGNVTRIYQYAKNGNNPILLADIQPVHYDNHPSPYILAGKGLFFVSGMEGNLADIRFLLMLGKNNPTEVHINGYDLSFSKKIIYQAIIAYDYNEKGYPTDMTVTASDSLSPSNSYTNLRLLFKDHFNYQDF